MLRKDEPFEVSPAMHYLYDFILKRLLADLAVYPFAATKGLFVSISKRRTEERQRYEVLNTQLTQICTVSVKGTQLIGFSCNCYPFSQDISFLMDDYLPCEIEALPATLKLLVQKVIEYGQLQIKLNMAYIKNVLAGIEKNQINTTRKYVHFLANNPEGLNLITESIRKANLSLRSVSIWETHYRQEDGPDYRRITIEFNYPNSTFRSGTSIEFTFDGKQITGFDMGLILQDSTEFCISAIDVLPMDALPMPLRMQLEAYYQIAKKYIALRHFGRFMRFLGLRITTKL
jgi:hypothetical protein